MTVARLRPKAQHDFVERRVYYRREGGDHLSDRFVVSARSAIRTIEAMPGVGSPRIGEMCGVAGLRSWRIDGFPYGWFYLPGTDHLDVVRLLSFSQDLGTILERVDPP